MSISGLGNIKRRLFVFIDDRLVCADEDGMGTHGEWFRNQGWMEKGRDEFLEKYPRGYVDEEGVYLYQGRDARLPNISIVALSELLSRLKNQLMINDQKCVYLGGKRGKTDARGKLEPIITLGPLNKLISI